MDNYLEIAKRYFLEFEGLHLYPTLTSWHWWAWIVSFSLFLWSLFPLASIASRTMWPTILFEVLFFACCFAIRSYRQKRLCAPAHARSGTKSDGIARTRARRLEQLCGAPRTEFATIAREISDLLELERSFRSSAAVDMGQMWRLVYDRDSKARLLAIVLAALALFVALLTKSSTEMSPSLIELIADKGLWTLLGLLLTATAFAFGIILGMRFALLQARDLFVMWANKLGRQRKATLTDLHYLVRDLIRFHQTHHSTSRESWAAVRMIASRPNSRGCRVGPNRRLRYVLEPRRHVREQ